MAIVPESTERIVAVVFRTLVFCTFLWGTATVLAGHFIVLHPIRHVGSLFEQVLNLSGASNSVTVTEFDKLVGSPSRFVLDPSWDIHAPPKTRVYHWTVSEIWGKPGHIGKRMLVVNGISPGPTIEANLRDRIVVHVVNQLENETTIHWHGQYQNGTNYYDGTFGITQCGIPPNGGKMTYNFTVQNVGTYWWHAHYSTQRTDGLYGAMVLHSAREPALTTVPYDQEAVVLLSDLYNTFSQDLLWRYHRYGTGIDGQPGDEPVGDGGTINGVSQARCAFTPSTNSILPERRRRRGVWSRSSPPTLPQIAKSKLAANVRGPRNSIKARNPGGQLNQPVIPENNTCVWESEDRYSTLHLTPGKTYRLRVINAGSLASTYFSIDNHPLTIVEADGTSVEPRIVNDIFIAAAQRYSVIVKLDQEPSSYWIRSTMDEAQLRYTGPNLNTTTLGVLHYYDTRAKLDRRSLPLSRPYKVIREDGPHLMNDLVPMARMDAPKPTKQITLTASMQYTSNGDHLSFFNYTSWEPLLDSTTLFHVQAALSPPSLDTPLSSSYSDTDQLIEMTPGIETIDLIVNNLDDGDHPFHLHGHTFWIVATGVGRYIHPGSEFSTYHPMYDLKSDNPMRRDTVMLPAYSFVVLRFVTGNPGLWAFHCHITWHLDSGLMMQFANLAGLDRLRIPSEVIAMCPGNRPS